MEIYCLEFKWVDANSIGKKGRNKWNISQTEYYAVDEEHFLLKVKEDFYPCFSSKMWKVERCGIHHDGSDAVEWDKDLTINIQQKINEELGNNPNLF